MAATIPIKFEQASVQPAATPLPNQIIGAIDGVRALNYRIPKLNWRRFLAHTAVAFITLSLFSVSLSEPVGRPADEAGWPLRPGKDRVIRSSQQSGGDALISSSPVNNAENTSSVIAPQTGASETGQTFNLPDLPVSTGLPLNVAPIQSLTDSLLP